MMIDYHSLVLTTLSLVLSVMGSLSSLGAEPALAADGSEGELLFDLTDAQTLSILESVDLEDVRVDEAGEDRTTFAFSVQGVDGYLRRYDATKDVRIYIVYPTSDEIGRERVELANRWNCRQRWAKTYIDDDGNWVIEADLLVGPGVTEEAIATFIRRFLATRCRFEEHIGLP